MKIVITANTSWYLYNFRKNLIHLLVKSGHEVTVVAPKDDYSLKLVELGATYCPIRMSPHGKNPFSELWSCYELLRLFRFIQPDYVLSFTVKSNLYSGICRRLYSFRQIANVSGLGEAFDKRSILNSIVSLLYRYALTSASRIYFQNDEDMNLAVSRKLVTKDVCLRLPGSGVSLDEFQSVLRTQSNRKRIFLMYGRLIPRKGYDLFMDVAESLQSYSLSAEFWIMGIRVKGLKSSQLYDRIMALQKNSTIKYLTRRDDVLSILSDVDVVVLPSTYNEGVPRSLLEAMACGKAIITTDWKGCRDTVDHGINGFLVKPGSKDDLEYHIEKLINASCETIQKMGEASRRKAVTEFDENYVLNAYLNDIN